MEHKLRGHYKLAKQTGTTAHFARTTVHVDNYSNGHITISASTDSIRGWEDAVLSGVQAAVMELQQRGYLKSDVSVDVCAFTGLPTDTTQEDARWSAFMAVISAFQDVPQPVLKYVGQTNSWVLLWSPN